MNENIDRIDRACDIEEQHRDDALAEQRRRSGLTNMTSEDSAVVCKVCETDIPQARREAYPGTQLCVDCQTDLETELRKFRR